MKKLFALLACITMLYSCGGNKKNISFSSSNQLVLNDSAYFETRGLNYFVFSNLYDAAFDDSKISAIEIIHHGIRTATNGDVRLNPTPGQWDPLPIFVERIVDKENKKIDVKLSYKKYEFDYTLTGEARDGGFYISVNTEKPVPEALIGIAGLNIEFAPPCLFGNSYIIDGKNGLFPTSPADKMTVINGQVEPLPIASGKKIEIAPDDPMKHTTISVTGDDVLMLFDGRNKQQNGNFVVRTLLPANKTGKIAEWFITAETNPNWLRTPVIAHSQVGYHPTQQKSAVIELDKYDKARHKVSLLKVEGNGKFTTVLSATPKEWGIYTRYNYLQFDFSSITEPGIYVLEYGDQRTAPFPIANDVFSSVWEPTLGVFLPVQMDHVFVREAYRVWHGAPHLDDALQAPVNYSHWDGWRQGPTTGNKYKPLQHIPGLNVGGWFDAGDFDIQTGSQQSVVQSLSLLWHLFAPKYDETTINQKTRYVEIHVPDGKPDVLQQIEHGTLQLTAQIRSIGYAIMGINESHLEQYRHLGDAVDKTDNKIYKPTLDSLQVVGDYSGTLDDRYAFTNRTAFMNYGSAISLATASRALKGYNDNLSKEALACAEIIWKDEHSGEKHEEPQLFGRNFNSDAFMKPLECRAAFELWMATGSEKYKAKMEELLPFLMNSAMMNMSAIAQMLPYLPESYKKEFEPTVKTYSELMTKVDSINPFGVNIGIYTWAGNRQIIQSSFTNYLLYKQFPDIINPEYIYRGLNYIFGYHPFHSLSFVSGVGAQPKQVAYGSNRADYTFIPGGVVPGIRILQPDFPENRDDYPFLWSENEYVIDVAADYILLVTAVNTLLN